MVSVHSKNLEITNAIQFRESVSEESNTKIYLTFGKVEPWSNDAAPPQANSSVSTLYQVWDNMIGGKLITGNDIHHVIRRINWTANTVYDQYDSLTSSLILFSANVNFYVVTDELNVYKCISNNYSSRSSVKPTSVSTTSTSSTADGYVWKFMYNISPSERIKFTTSDYIPVKKLSSNDNSLQWQVQENATEGAINHIQVTNGGLNYFVNSALSISITGDGTGANAFARVNTVSNTIANVVIDSVGSEYTYATVTLTSNTGSNASFRAIISPPNGHGSDALRELGGANLMINPRLRGTETGILSVANEFRQISLIEDPTFFNQSNVASNTVFSQLTSLTVNGSSVEYDEDEIVYQGTSLSTSTFSGRIAEWDSSNSIMRLTNVTGNPTTDLLIGANTGAARFVDSVTNPTLKRYSGNLLYIDNIEPIQRAIDQTEDFKIVLKF
jgi:hypothetical protein